MILFSRLLATDILTEFEYFRAWKIRKRLDGKKTMRKNLVEELVSVRLRSLILILT